MARGRKAQPAEIAAAKGNPGKRALGRPKDGEGEISLPPESQSVHPYLSNRARAIWERLAPQLRAMKMLRETDVEGVARYCEYLNRWWVLERRLRRKSITYETVSAHGKLRRMDPDFLAQGMIEKRLVALEDRYGLSPRARQEILRALAAAPLGLPLGEKSREGEAPSAPADSPVGLLSRADHWMQ